MEVQQFINTQFNAGDRVRKFSGDKVGEVFAASRLGVTVVWPGGERTSHVASELECVLSVDVDGAPLVVECSKCMFQHLATTACPECNPPRYRYERYQDSGYAETTYGGRVQWLIFDRNGVGCIAKAETKAIAEMIVDGLNATPVSA